MASAISLRLSFINIKKKTTLIIASVGIALGGTGLPLVLAGTVQALPSAVVYNNVPSPLPGNLPSEAFEATSTSEFGGQVQFAGTARTNPTVMVEMSSWGCQTGNWYTGNCSTTPGSTFSEPITLNVYNVAAGNAVGTSVATKTQTFSIPYRPSADATNCTGTEAGEWYSSANVTCYNGFTTPVSFNLTGVTLPSTAIVTVAYNTSDYGASPYGDSTSCHATTAGCGYDSLNVGLVNVAPSVGSDPVANSDYLNSSFSGSYCDNGVNGTGMLRFDTGSTGADSACPYEPAIQVTASPALIAPPTHYSQCEDNGWKQFNDPSFKNRGDCMNYVWRHASNIDGDNAQYTAYGLKREANFWASTALNRGDFHYSDANHDWYDVRVSDVSVSGNNGYFAGVVTNASNHGWVGNWLYAEVENGHPDQIWGSFTDQTTALNGVNNMSPSPSDGPFVVTKGNISIRH